MPNSGRWKICADELSECWYCEQHIMTLFIWTPSISHLAQVQDQGVKNYYKDAIDSIIDANPHFETIEDKDTPHIIGPFTNWKYCEMRQVVPFCLNNDPNPPDFLTMAVKKKILS